VANGLIIALVGGTRVGDGGGVNVGATAPGIPQAETITAMARRINIFLFMGTRLYKVKLLHASIARGKEIARPHQPGNNIIFDLDDGRPADSRFFPRRCLPSHTGSLSAHSMQDRLQGYSF